MIFVTVGTSEPFDRLLSAVAELATDEEIVIQAGRSRVSPANARVLGFVPYDEIVELMRRARVVVCHAGVGSIVTALTNGKKPLVVPRRAAFREAVDDHQVAFARSLARAGMVVDVDVRELAHAVSRHRGDVDVRGDGRLAAELREYVRGAVVELRA